MRVVFYLVGTDPERLRQAGMMQASLRAHMDVDLVQLTDLETPAMQGVDGVERLERTEPMTIHWARLMAQEEECLMIATDMLFLESLEGVFEKEVAMPRKKWNLVPGKVPRQLYNGLVYTNGCDFWKDYLKDIQRGQNWRWKLADRSLTTAAWSYDVQELDAKVYNYQPIGRTDDIRGKKVLHFKAWRKELMDAYYQA